MIELDERICYSPQPPEAYSREGVGHGLWVEGMLKTWNICWLSFPAVDAWLDPSRDMMRILDDINPQHWGSVSSIGEGVWDQVFPNLSAHLRKPPREFLHKLLDGPYKTLAPFKLIGPSWIDTIRARVDESQPEEFVPVESNVVYADFGRRGR